MNESRVTAETRCFCRYLCRLPTLQTHRRVQARVCHSHVYSPSKRETKPLFYQSAKDFFLRPVEPTDSPRALVSLVLMPRCAGRLGQTLKDASGTDSAAREFHAHAALDALRRWFACLIAEKASDYEILLGHAIDDGAIFDAHRRAHAFRRPGNLEPMLGAVGFELYRWRGRPNCRNEERIVCGRENGNMQILLITRHTRGPTATRGGPGGPIEYALYSLPVVSNKSPRPSSCVRGPRTVVWCVWRNYLVTNSGSCKNYL